MKPILPAGCHSWYDVVILQETKGSFGDADVEALAVLEESKGTLDWEDPQPRSCCEIKILET